MIMKLNVILKTLQCKLISNSLTFFNNINTFTIKSSNHFSIFSLLYALFLNEIEDEVFLNYRPFSASFSLFSSFQYS